jgi:hypothetical protein
MKKLNEKSENAGEGGLGAEKRDGTTKESTDKGN